MPTDERRATPAVRSGRSAAAASTVWPPALCPRSTTGSYMYISSRTPPPARPSSASTAAHTLRAICSSSGSAPSSSMGGDAPWPGRSRVKHRTLFPRARSWSTSGPKSRLLPGMPWTSTIRGGGGDDRTTGLPCSAASEGDRPCVPLTASAQHAAQDSSWSLRFLLEGGAVTCPNPHLSASALVSSPMHTAAASTPTRSAHTRTADGEPNATSWAARARSKSRGAHAAGTVV
mmetsp:Transcript_48465/g.160597  ORF Transcript_48465/g.160597 Transcript_48465/m.160597 type:complete len:232 (+) Transcript_48465:512-1207(+)